MTLETEVDLTGALPPPCVVGINTVTRWMLRMPAAHPQRRQYFRYWEFRCLRDLMRRVRRPYVAELDIEELGAVIVTTRDALDGLPPLERPWLAAQLDAMEAEYARRTSPKDSS
jgi:hypothetical protein